MGVEVLGCWGVGVLGFQLRRRHPGLYLSGRELSSFVRWSWPRLWAQTRRPMGLAGPVSPNTPTPQHLNTSTPYRSVTLALACWLLALVPVSAAGIYVDAGGGRHGWKVNAAHALLWEEKAYL